MLGKKETKKEKSVTLVIEKEFLDKILKSIADLGEQVREIKQARAPVATKLTPEFPKSALTENFKANFAIVHLPGRKPNKAMQVVISNQLVQFMKKNYIKVLSANLEKVS